MSDKIKESLEALQKEYNQMVAEYGHALAQVAVKEEEVIELQKNAKSIRSRICSVIDKVKSLQANQPKEEVKEEKPNGES